MAALCSILSLPLWAPPAHALDTAPQGFRFRNGITGETNPTQLPPCSPDGVYTQQYTGEYQDLQPSAKSFYDINIGVQIGICFGGISDSEYIFVDHFCPDGVVRFHVNNAYYVCRYADCPEGQTRNAVSGQCEVAHKPSPHCAINTNNPVNLGTGEKWLRERDRDANAFGALGLNRYYNYYRAFGDIDSPMGVNWVHSYQRRLEIDPVTLLWLNARRSDGKVYRFTYTPAYWRADGTGYDYGEPQWLPEDDIEDRLVRLDAAHAVPNGWQYTTANNITELYDAGGKLVSITTLEGHNETLSYDASNRLERVDAVTSEYLVFSYNTDGRVQSITDQAGRSWGYRYDAVGNLEFIDNPDLTTRQYHYNEQTLTNNTDLAYALTGITDERASGSLPFDRYATFGYDSSGRAEVSTRAGNAERIDITYASGDVRTVTNSKGLDAIYTTEFNLGAARIGQVSGAGCAACGVNGDAAYQYDPANNNLLSKTENGLTTDYGNYDAKGQYSYKIEAVGTTEQHRTDYTYDNRFFNKIMTITEPSVFAADSTAQCTVGTDCKITNYTYDDYGNRLTETVSGYDASGNAVSRTTTRQYTGPLNQLSFVDGPRTDVNDFTTYRYHPNDIGQPIGTRARLSEIENANDILVRSNIQYTTTGKVMSEQRSNGLTLNYTYYSGNDRLETLTESDDTTSRITQWAYLATGEVQTITTGFGNTSATTLAFGYDDARRLTRITDGLGNYIEYTLDTEGNRKEEKTYDNTNALKKQLSQTFDIYNRLDTTAQANESTNPNFAPDGTLDIRTDGEGTVTDYSYDALKRLTQVIQNQSGTDPTTADATTGYDYDVADRLTAVTDPVNGNTTYAYDDLGNLLSQTSPDTGTTGFLYDAAGNLTQKTDALGQVFSYTYDALNRLISVDAPGSADDIGYAYDNCPNGSGRLCRVTYGSGNLPNGSQVQYQYTAFGDISQQQGILYGFDAQGRVTTLDYPSGARVTYSHDAAGQINQVDFTVNGQTQTLAGNISYAPFGPVTGLSFGNSLLLTQTLDDAYRLTAQTVPGVLERSYPGYDANGNRLSQTDTLTTNSSYTYDPLNRLDTGSGPFGSRDYNYDKNGNRTQLDVDTGTSVTPYAYEPNSNRLDTLGATDVLLDDNGNTLNQGAWTYSYTPHNRLSTATENATLKASFAYNGLGQRFRKIDASTGNGHHYLYGDNGELRVETDQDGNILNEYLYLNSQLLAVYAPDDDQDGIPNAEEARQGTLPVNTDSDGDGLTNLSEWFQHGTDSANTDSDGDGILDGVEIASNTNPNSAIDFPGDGDINADGTTNLGDLVLLYQFVIGNRTPTAAEFTHADMNQDSELTVADILLLQQQLLAAALRINITIAKASPLPPVRGQTWPQASSDPLLTDWINRLIPPVHAVPANSGVLYYVHNDPLGTPQALTDESGAVVWTGRYDPFGSATTSEDPDGDGNSIEFNIRFSGQYFDKETGLHQNGFRTYHPGTGRYLTSDLLGIMLDNPSPEMLVAEEVGSVELPYDVAKGYINHPYAYVDSNPLLYTDSYGLHHKSSHRWKPRPGSVSLGDYISDPNGNLWPGTQRQDGRCTLGPVLGPIGDTCFPERCIEHDQCYSDNECNYSSWIPNLLGGSKSCNKCNLEFFD